MKIRIQSFSFHASDELIGLGESTLNKLSQYSDQIKEAQMTLTIDPSGPIELKVCEVRLGLHGYDLFASEQCQSFEEAILKASRRSATTVNVLRKWRWVGSFKVL